MSKYEIFDQSARSFLRKVQGGERGVCTALYRVYSTNRRRFEEDNSNEPSVASFLNSARSDLAELGLVVASFCRVSPKMVYRIENS